MSDLENDLQHNETQPEAPAVQPEPEAQASTPQPEPGSVFAPEPTHEPEPTPLCYTDAGYIPAGEAPVTPRQFTSVPPTYHYTEKPRKKRRGWLIALLCVLFLGVGVGAGYFAFAFLPERRAAHADSSEAEAGRHEELPGEVDIRTRNDSEQGDIVVPTIRTGDIDPDALPAYEIYSSALGSVVGISSEITYYNIFGQQVSSAVSGTGFVIDAGGYILTNHHVIETAYNGGYAITVTFADGTEYTASVVGAESDNDIAVLKIEAEGLVPVELGNSDNLVVGSTIYTVGHPLGELSYTMTSGIISAKDREIATDTSTTINMFQLDAAVNSGNSGGPVFNAAGQVIGIVTAKYSKTGVEGLGFAVPINDAVRIANELITNGYVTGKAYLGIYYDRNYDSVVQQYYSMPGGVYVSQVVEGSCADTAGIRENDVITALDDREISASDDLVQALKEYRAGDSAVITVYRDGDYVELPITFDEEPHEDPQQQQQQQQQQQYYGNQDGSGSYFYGFPWNW